MNHPPLSDLLAEWLLELAAHGRSPKTIKNYATSVGTFVTYCDEAGKPSDISTLNRRTINGWLNWYASRTVMPTRP